MFLYRLHGARKRTHHPRRGGKPVVRYSSCGWVANAPPFTASGGIALDADGLLILGRLGKSLFEDGVYIHPTVLLPRCHYP